MKNIITPGSISEDSLMYDQKVKYLIYSAHDTNVVNILEHLNPVNEDLKGVQYAASIYYELHKSDTIECARSQDSKCFTVKIRYNDKDLQLPGCQNLECTFSEFEAQIL